MFSTFADVFSSDDFRRKNSIENADETPTNESNVDPFGISSEMKLSASSQCFDDTPFGPLPTFNETNFDPLEDLTRKKSNLNIEQNLTHSKSVNLIDPFRIPNISNESSNAVGPTNPIDLLFDLNVDPSCLSPSSTSIQHAEEIQSSYDLLGLNRTNSSSNISQTKIVKSDSLTEIEKKSQTKKTATTSLTTKSVIPQAASYHSLPTTNVPTTSPSNLRVQATALTILTGTTTATDPFNDQFLDWLTQSDDLMCGVDPKISGPSKKIDLNMIKSTEDLLGSICRPIPTFNSTQEENVEISSSRPIRRPSTEDLPSICIHEPTSEHNDSNIVPQGYFDMKKARDESEESDDEKMVFKISEKRVDHSSSPVPLLPPPPSPCQSSKKSTNVDSSSSDGSDDEKDPLAIFRSKTDSTSVVEQGKSLFVDWEEEKKDVEVEVVSRVCVISSIDVVSLSKTKFNRQRWIIIFTNLISMTVRL